MAVRRSGPSHQIEDRPPGRERAKIATRMRSAAPASVVAGQIEEMDHTAAVGRDDDVGARTSRSSFSSSW